MIHRLLSLMLWLVCASCTPSAAPVAAATIPITPATYLAALPQ